MTTINPSFVPTSFYGANNELTVDQKLAQAVQTDVKAKLDEIPDAQADNRFLAAIADLSPSQVDTPEERKELFTKFAAAAQKLDSASGPGFSADELLPFTGDISKFLARAMIEQAGQQRQQAVDDRMNARQAAQAEMLSQANQMEKAANEMMTGAIVNAVIGGLGAAMSFVGSASSFTGQMKGIAQMNSSLKQSTAAQKSMDGVLDQVDSTTKASKAAEATKNAGLTRVEVNVSAPQTGRARSDAFSAGSGKAVDGTTVPGSVPTKGTTADTDAAIAKLNQKEQNLANMSPDQAAAYRSASADKAKADMTFQIADKTSQAQMTLGQVWESMGGMMKTVGGAADSGMQATAKKSEAEGSRDAAQAEYLKQVADGHKEIQDAMSDMMKQIINFIKELQDAEVEAMRAITRG